MSVAPPKRLGFKRMRRGFACLDCGEYLPSFEATAKHDCDPQAAAEKQDDKDADAEHAAADRAKPKRKRRAKKAAH